MKPKHTAVWLSVPATFDPANNPELKGFENEANWLVHKVIHVTNCYRHDDPDLCKYRAVSRRTMEQFIRPSDVSAVRNALLGMKVINCDRSYKKGSHAMGYRLGGDYLAVGFKWVEVTKRSLAAKILRHRTKYQGNVVTEEQLAPVYNHLRHWLKQLRIDMNRAYIEIDAKAGRDAAEAKRLGKKGRKKLAVEATRALNRMTAEMINRRVTDGQEPEWEVCDYGRVHTNVTRLLTEARSCLSINGSNLVNLDLANSQVVFFCLMLQEHLYGILSQDDSSPTPGTPIPPRTNKPEGENDWHEGTARAAYAAEPRISQYQLLPPDARRFIDLTLEGRIYDTLMDELGETDRKKFKQSFFLEVLYGNDKAGYAINGKINKLFRSTYPTIYQFIKDQKKGDEGERVAHEAKLKGRKETKRNKYKPYAKLARRMQERESRFVIGQVCERLASHHPDIPVITIHDSIMTTPEYAETVLRIMRQEFSRLGIRPTIRVEGGAEGRQQGKAAA